MFIKEDEKELCRLQAVEPKHEEPAGFDGWLSRNHLVRRRPKPTLNLEKLTEELFPSLGKSAFEVAMSFIRTSLGSKQLPETLYSPAFIEFLEKHRSQLRELLSDHKSTNNVVMLTILSQLFKTRVKLIHFSEGEISISKLGSEDWPSEIVIARINNRLLPLQNETKDQREGFTSTDLTDEFFEQKREQEKSEDSEGSFLTSQLDLSTSQIPNKRGSSVRSDLSILETFDNLHVVTKADSSLPNFRFLPYPSNKSPGPRSERSSQTLNVVNRKLPIDSCTSLSQVSNPHQQESSFVMSQHGSSMLSQPSQSSTLIRRKFLGNVLQEDQAYRTGFVKFYNAAKEFGFITSNNEEFFLHKDDLIKAGIDIINPRVSGTLQHREVQFRVIQYKGKSKVSLKAIDIKLI